MRRLLPALLLLGLAVPTLADTPLTAEGFDAHVTGTTITYERHGSVFGIEEYLPDRKVRWSVMPGECQYGTWYPEGENICFVYEYDPTPACWTFWLRDDALVALSVYDAPGNELYETVRDATPLPCPGPDVGV